MRGSVFTLCFLYGTSLVTPVASAAQDEVTSLPCTEPGSQYEVRGVVADLLSRYPLPGVIVTIGRSGGTPAVLAVTETGVDGDYVFCFPGRPGRDLLVTAELDTLESRSVSVLEHGAVDTLYIRWSEPAELSGRVRMMDSGEPIVGARISVDGRGVRALTDGSGSFRIRGLGAGPVVLTTSRIGLDTRSDSIFIEAGADLFVDVRMSAEAIELPPVTVSVASGEEAQGVRFFGMTEDDIEELLPRVPDLATLLHLGRTPGLSARAEADRGGICIEFLRRAAVSCSMVAVFVDGVLIAEPASYLASLPLEAVREIRVYPPTEARFRFYAPNIGNGAIDFILR